MSPSIDPAILSALKSSCPHLGSTFEASGSSRIIATSLKPPRTLFGKCTTPVEQVLGEAASLSALERACESAGLDRSLVPKVHTYGSTEDGRKAYLVTDYADFSPSLGGAAQKQLGLSLAKMHRASKSPTGQFGFERPTHCGVTEQDNTWNDSWASFWADQRIGEIVRRIGDSKLTSLEKEMRSKVYPLLLETLKDVQPAIIHGDLWSGNAGQSKEDGSPIIFDPSSYYGHNEAELGIMNMFGGFNSDFFRAYHSIIPKASPEEYYEQRIKLYELYHHLNHALMFSGGYKSGASRIMESLIAWAEKQGGKKPGRAEL